MLSLIRTVLTTMLSVYVCTLLSSCSGQGGGQSSVATDSRGASGKAGSTARFLVLDNYLYTISGTTELELFNIMDPSNPSPWANVHVSWNIETLFADRGYLFIGAFDGVYIYDNSDPANPLYVSRFSHLRSCDPVVVQGNYAYATLRGGGRCFNANNELDVINISDIRNPFLEKTYVMKSPEGLGIDGDKLFVCDDSAGLKIYNARNPLQLAVLDVKPNIDCSDVIPDRQSLVVSDAWGILQLDYSSIPVMTLSDIPLQ